MNYGIIAEAFRCGTMQDRLGYGGKEEEEREDGRFLLVWWSLTWDTFFGRSTFKLMIRVCWLHPDEPSASALPSYHPTCLALQPALSWSDDLFVSAEQI